MEQQITKPLRVLYINHYGIFGGAQRSILALVFGFPQDYLQAYFISPKGSVTPFFEKWRVPYFSLPGIQGDKVADSFTGIGVPVSNTLCFLEVPEKGE